jgi:hypothetical protein
LVNPVANNSKYGYTTGDDLYQEDETATVTATAYSGYKFANWTKNGIEVSTSSSYSFTVAEDVELIANFESEVGIGNVEYDDVVKIFPNPTNGEFKVQSSKFEVLRIEIFDVMGREVQSSETLNTKHETLNISYLPAGIYFVRIQTDKGVITRKVVKN